MNRRIFIFFFLLLSFRLAAQQESMSLNLKDAEKRFQEHNLSLIAEHYNIDMARAQVMQAKLFENPVISFEQNVYNGLNGRYFDFGKQGDWNASIEQVISIAGQRNQRIRLEKANQKTSEYQFEEVLRTLHSELNSTFAQVYFSSKSLDIYDKEISSLEQLLRVMKEQQSKGNVSMLESARIEALLFSLRKEKTEAEDALHSLRGELNILLSLPPQQEVKLLFDEGIFKQIDISSLSLSALESHLLERPDIKLANAQMEASQVNLKLQKALAYPSVSLKGAYDKSGSFMNNYFGLGFSVSVPVFNRNQGNIKSARLETEQNNAEKSMTQEKAKAELYMAYTRLQKSLELYKQSNEALEHDFEHLITGVNDNFRKRNISMPEFIDYYESYKNVCLQLNETRKNVLLAMENLNTVTGRTLFSY
ncbi:TolC family protein [uncultured Bacteroides sp.]|uniref:TolC family protein n=1 Tax=uncultured Bacteroides sp. TaxID=162156 RepID=UPI002AAC362A|nr:TolC family protein [uncultured Bacteroides sp.]